MSPESVGKLEVVGETVGIPVGPELGTTEAVALGPAEGINVVSSAVGGTEENDGIEVGTGKAADGWSLAVDGSGLPPVGVVDGAVVSAPVGAVVGSAVGPAVGPAVGRAEGTEVGTVVGAVVGAVLGAVVTGAGSSEGEKLGASD